MVGGEESDVEKCRPVFATYADPIVHLGPPGGGQVTKILNNLLFTANLGSAMSTLGRIVVFGGSLEGLAPHAGGLLQKDVRHATSLAAAASAPEGSVFTIADTALTLMHHPR
ncbi:MAG: hypothetical protein QOG79_392 [Mycobacterium sp.]|jgi:hypothetical protein|nr:hypothetical protein [Mycobacterium sp.]